MASLLDYFDAAYVINLPERTDRRRSVMGEFARIGWRIGPGGVEIYPAIKLEDRAGFPSAAVRSCFHSHLACLKKAHERRCRNVLIMEDDIAFARPLARLSATLIARLASTPWSFVYLGHEKTGDIARAGADTEELNLAVAPRDVLGAHFYCVASDILPKLIQHLERAAKGAEGDRELGPMPVDGAFNIFRRMNPGLASFIVTPKLGWQRPSRSDITPGRLDRATGLRFFLSAYRGIKHAAMRWRA